MPTVILMAHEITPYNKVKEVLAKIDLKTPLIEGAKADVQSHHSEDLDAFIPFYMEGSAISFDSRIPSNHELETLPQVVITSKEPWDPKSNPLRITLVRCNAALLKPKIQHEMDHILRSVSDILDEHELCRRAVSSVHVTEPGSEPGPESRITSRNEPRPEFYPCEPGPGPVPTCEPGPAPASYTPAPAPTYEPGPAPGPTIRPHVSTLHPTKRPSDVTPENFSRIWNIGLETAQRTLRITTQFGTRSAIHPITRCYHVDHLHYNRRRLLNTIFYTDGLQSCVVSLRGNKHAQVYINGQFTTIYPSSSKSKAGDSLRELSDDVDIPENLIAALAGEQSGQHTEFLHQCRHLHLRLHHTEKDGRTRTTRRKGKLVF